MSVEIDGVNNIIKADTINESTSGSGVTIDGVLIKDTTIDVNGTAGALILDTDADTKIQASTDDNIEFFTAGKKQFNLTSFGSVQAFRDSATTFGPSFLGVHQRGTIASPSIVQSGDKIVEFKSVVYDGTAYLDGPRISFKVDGTPGDDDMPTSIEFQVGADGTASLYAAMTLHNNGSLITNPIAGGVTVFNENSVDSDFRVESNGNANMIFVDGGSDHVNIGTATDLGGMFNVGGNGVFQNADQSDTLSLVNTDADANVGPRLRFFRNSSSPADADLTGDIRFETKNNAGQDVVAAQIKTNIGDVRDGNEFGEMNFHAMVNGTLTEFIALSSNVAPAIVFNEQSADIDFRVESNGHTDALFVDAGQNEVFFFASDTPDGSNRGGAMFQASNNERAVLHCSNTGTANNSLIVFNNGNGVVGTIKTNGSATAFNTSSDYRLKENVNYTWDATTELKKLKPAKFNFKADASTTVEGFLAHEVSSIVPIAVAGDKDGVDKNGDPDYQGIDQSKLVPLMVKTIQELEARIKTLEG